MWETRTIVEETGADGFPLERAGRGRSEIRAVQARPANDRTARFALLAGGSTLLLLGGAFLMADLGLACGLALNAALALLGGGSLALGWVLFVEKDRRLAAAALTATLAWLLAGTALSTRLVDFSYDGQTAHLVAAGLLAHGEWNPWVHVPHSLTAHGLSANMPAYLSHNPKLGWVLSGIAMQTVGTLESAKVVNLAALWMAFWCCVASLAARAPGARGLRFLLPLALLSNPVVLTQVATSYVDGLGYLFLATTLALAVFPGTGALPLVALATAAAANVKFNATFFLAVLLVSLWAWKGLRPPLTRTALLGFLAGVLVLGFHPYLTNWLGYGSPVHPYQAQALRSSEGDLSALELRSASATSSDTPPPLRGRSRVEAMLISLGSASRNGVAPGDLQPPWPFTSARDQFRVFRIPDTRIGGFGPFFLPALLLSAGVLAWSVVSRRTSRGLLCLVAGVLVSAALFPEGWWARYVPHLWLIPAATAGCTLLATPRAPRLVQGAGALILILLLATGLAVTRVQVRHQWNTSAGIRRHLVEVARHAPLEVCFGPFLANRDRLKEAGIPFVEVPSSRASTMQAFPYSEARYAPAGAPRNGSSSAWHKTSSGR